MTEHVPAPRFGHRTLCDWLLRRRRSTSTAWPPPGLAPRNKKSIRPTGSRQFLSIASAVLLQLPRRAPKCDLQRIDSRCLLGTTPARDPRALVSLPDRVHYRACNAAAASCDVTESGHSVVVARRRARPVTIPERGSELLAKGGLYVSWRIESVGLLRGAGTVTARWLISRRGARGTP